MRFFNNRTAPSAGVDTALGGPSSEGERDLEEKHVHTSNDLHASDNSSVDDLPDKDVQNGVKKAQAVTISWTRTQLIVAYAL